MGNPYSLFNPFLPQMSKRDFLKDTLLEEICRLEVFTRLVRYSPARSKLLRIMASLMASKKPLASRLSEAYIARYGQDWELNGELDGERQAEGMLQLPSAARQDDRARELLREYNTLHAGDDEAAGTSSSSSTCRSQNKVGLQTEPSVMAPTNLQELPAEELQAIDMGLRLGSFLSEAGWMQESIAVLSCLNARLKRLPPHKYWLELRYDCLQRYLNYDFLVYNVNYKILLIFGQPAVCRVGALQLQAGTPHLRGTDRTEPLPDRHSARPAGGHDLQPDFGHVLCPQRVQQQPYVERSGDAFSEGFRLAAVSVSGLPLFVSQFVILIFH